MSGLRFSLRCRLVSRSDSEKFWVVLRCRFGNFQQMLHNFSGNLFPVLFAFGRSVDKVFQLEYGFGQCCLYVQRLLGWCACLHWPLICFVTVQLADGADLEPYSIDRADALGLKVIHLGTTELRCHGWCRFFAQHFVCLPLGCFGSGGNFYHQQLSWRELMTL